jgi:hypothetical protein
MGHKSDLSSSYAKCNYYKEKKGWVRLRMGVRGR